MVYDSLIQEYNVCILLTFLQLLLDQHHMYQCM